MSLRQRPAAVRLLAACVLLASTIGCGGDVSPIPIPPPPAPPPPPPPPPPGNGELEARLTTAYLWPGGEVEVEIRGLATPPVEVSLSIDATSIPLEQVDAFLWRGTVPVDARPSARYPILFTDGVGYLVDSYVRLVGRSGEQVHAAGGPLARAVPYSIGTTAKLLVPTDGPLAFLDLDAGTILSDARLRSTAPGGPAPTYDRHVWLLQPEVDGPLERWRIWPYLERLDTVPRFGQPSFDAYALLDFELFLGFVGDQGWIRELRHDGTWRSLVGLEVAGPKRVLISPDRRRAVLTGSQISVPVGAQYDPVGAPILSLEDGSVARTLPGVSTIHAADFSPQGDHVVVATDDSTGQPRRLLIETSYWSLVVVHDTTLEQPIRGLAYDPYRPWLYVATGAADGPLDLLVFRTGSYRLVGRMRDPCQDPCTGEMLVVPSVVDNVFVVLDRDPALRSIRFVVPTVYDR